ncbi:MAG: N-acetylmuramoyl-L-alanine amidase [Faecalibacterium sp.]
MAKKSFLIDRKRSRRGKSRKKRGHAAIRWLLLGLWAALLAGFCIWSFAPKAQPVSAEEAPSQEGGFRPQIGEPPYTIAVDAGHGGGDPGAIGLVEEAQMTRQTAQLLCRWLEADPNYIAVHTRETYDTSAAPSERAAYANTQDPDLLISIHGNSAPEGSEASGFECYPVVPGRTWHQESFYFAQLLAKGMQSAGASLRGNGGVRYIYYLENGEKKILDTNYAQVREERTFSILEDAGCPAVLAEQCFVTNAADLDQFGDEDGCQRTARIYYEAICGYFDTQPLVQDRNF